MTDILPRSDDLEATWNFIEPAINQILGQNDQELVNKRVNKILSPTMYMEVYTAIYNYCVNKSRSTGQFSSDRVHSNGQSSILIGSEIYEKLKHFLKRYITNFTKKENETFLEFYVRRWKRFTIGSIFLNHAFDYMNRYWVQKERSDGKRDIFDVNTLCLITWKQVMFDSNSELLANEILQQITMERNEQSVHQSNLITAIKSFVALGIDPQDLKKLNLNVYLQNFEKPFLTSTEEYYTKFSNEFLENHSVTDYISKARNIIYQEEESMSIYWDEHTRKPLSETLNAVLITKHVKKLEDEFVTLLDARDEINISALYILMQRDFTLMPQLANVFEQYIKKTGEDEVLKLLKMFPSANGSQKTPALIIPPKEYIKKLIEVYKIFLNITQKCFNNDPLFTKALDNACRSYVNVNAYAIPPGNTNVSVNLLTSKTPEMLAKYSDQLLKKSTKPEISNDMNVDDIMMIFKFLTDKDAFETHYRRLFAKRLIHGTSTRDSDEESIIQRLQSENSMEYTGKIAKMFQDVRLSKIVEEEFNSSVKELPDYSPLKYPELEPFILAETMWPFQYQESEYTVPPDLKPSFTKLEDMYITKHSGRILKWLYPLCRGELQANIAKTHNAPFNFTVTLYQMSILLLYNGSENNQLTLEQIQEGTNLKINNIAASMIPFIKYKLIQQVPPGLNNLIQNDTIFKLNTPYKALKPKINFASGVKNDIMNLINANTNSNNTSNGGATNAGPDMGSNTNLSENEKIAKELNIERQIYLEACIVRIMKTNRTMPHTTLINDVIQQAHQRFNPKIAMIKKAIDNLIQKEYLVRGEDGESYRYLA
ncbi:hypothetical protein TPHA_0P00850 [Tetrapisispora phaffii CBS 4417]|uniref:Cullin family profile domain-containing protein n=1 Tax=Tetrapisispora phaffii (strain ATCC 24235 / CBS 4417 / NBRC 1672 / NRRL Y-8282 / UCD 70-5) TaxID=1071381 RepID=G8C265_TETPH|nr:hypothetical protein TPHA_0P00850 [Tetrapisispora phaffii CBS 4417]CCE66243.1 hypothetical protein TPHA_0P00850 [Tetrapisispora phaffii CBS 4417]